MYRKPVSQSVATEAFWNGAAASVLTILALSTYMGTSEWNARGLSIPVSQPLTAIDQSDVFYRCRSRNGAVRET